MFPMDLKPVQVTIEYDKGTGRTRKTFPNANAAKSFFCRKLKEGKTPKVISSRLPPKTA